MHNGRDCRKFRITDYILAVLLVFAFFVLIYAAALPHEDTRFDNEEALIFTDGWQYVSASGEKYTVSLPCTLPNNINGGIRVSHVLPENSGAFSFNCIAFYNAFSECRVYYNGRLICTAGEKKKGARYIDSTADSYWSIVRLPSDAAGGTVMLDMTSKYPQYRCLGRVILGTKASILFLLARTFMWQQVIAFIVFVSGIVMLGGFIYDRHGRTDDYSALFLGMFQVWVGVWEYSESYLFQFLTGSAVFINALSFISVRITAAMLLAYVSEKIRGHWKIWNMCLICAFAAETVVDTVLQLLHIADYIRTMPALHLLLIISAVTIIFEIFYNFIVYRDKSTGSVGLVVSTGMIAVLTVAAVYDVYFGDRKYISQLIGLGILIFIIINTAQEIRNMAAEKKLAVIARHYKVLSETDHMTGCANRVAMDEFINVFEAYPQAMKNKVTIIAADVDHLKLINDRYGHMEGDNAICLTAELLRKHFSEYGISCRVGGDEFVCLLKNMAEQDVRRNVAEIDSEAAGMENSIGYRYSVSVGYAVYNAEQDRNLHDTIARADEWMYKIKREHENDEPSTQT